MIQKKKLTRFQFKSSGEKQQPWKQNWSSVFVQLAYRISSLISTMIPAKKRLDTKTAIGFCRFAVLSPQISIGQWSQKWCKVLIPSHLSFIEETMYQSIIHETTQPKRISLILFGVFPPSKKKTTTNNQLKSTTSTMFFFKTSPNLKISQRTFNGSKNSKSVNDDLTDLNDERCGQLRRIWLQRCNPCCSPSRWAHGWPWRSQLGDWWCCFLGGCFKYF